MIHWLGYVLIFIFVLSFVVNAKGDHSGGGVRLFTLVLILANLLYIILTEIGYK